MTTVLLGVFFLAGTAGAKNVRFRVGAGDGIKFPGFVDAGGGGAEGGSSQPAVGVLITFFAPFRA